MIHMITWLEGMLGLTTIVTSVSCYLSWRNACVEKGMRKSAERKVKDANHQIDRMKTARQLEELAKGEYTVRQGDYDTLEAKHEKLKSKANNLYKQAIAIQNERDNLKVRVRRLEWQLQDNSGCTVVDNAVIKAALRKYMACVHPDQQGGSTEKFQQVQNVYDKFK